MNLPFFVFCITTFVLTVIIDTRKKIQSQEKKS
jgi:hypothetical protein